MNSIGECDDEGTVEDCGAGDRGGSRKVLVGVKLDPRSRELLTWALVKVAEPGDLVIALHVFDTITEDTSSILALLKTFDSVLSVYEGFCNLKQIVLKLKMCKGASARKLLVQEAKSLGVATVILGTSKQTHHPLRSSTSVAKYCAKKLPKCISVLAVDNGKVVFHREATGICNDQVKLNEMPTMSQTSFAGYTKKNLKACDCCARVLSLPENPATKLKQELPDEKKNSLALIPIENPDDATSYPSVVEKSNRSKPGWSLLHRVFLPRTHMQKTLVNTELSGLPTELLGLREKYSSLCRIFSFQELESATANFSLENLVGTGGCSHVYRGFLPDGKELAVKVLKSSGDVLKEFVQEIEILTTLHHKNIISFSGFCFEGKNLLLVYDFLSRGSLDENLYGNKKDCNAFGWQERYKVAVGVAEALDYLHNGCADAVIHRDVKSSNILLSDDFEPQLSDFGMASWGSSSHSICTDVAGTFGYLAPEYFMHGRVTDKIDLYAFGVVLLELLSSRKPINNECGKGPESIVMWARSIVKGGKLSQLLDPSLGSDCDPCQIERMAMAATLSIRRVPKLRPQIGIILKLLCGDGEVTRWAEQVCASQEPEGFAREPVPTNIQSYLNLALLDLEDDTDSTSSSTENVSLEDYLRGRCSRSSSFD